jgi:hypothetical protein
MCGVSLLYFEKVTKIWTCRRKLRSSTPKKILWNNSTVQWTYLVILNPMQVYCYLSRAFFTPCFIPSKTWIKRRFSSGVIFGIASPRAFFNYITTGAFTPVGPLFVPVVKQDSQMKWALLIISKKLTLLKKLHPACFLISSHILDIPSYKSQNSQGWC